MNLLPAKLLLELTAQDSYFLRVWGQKRRFIYVRYDYCRRRCLRESALLFMRKAAAGTLLSWIENGVGGLIKNVSCITHYEGVLDQETGAEFAKRMQDQADRYNVEVVEEKVIDTKLDQPMKTVVTEQNTVYRSRRNHCGRRNKEETGHSRLKTIQACI